MTGVANLQERSCQEPLQTAAFARLAWHEVEEAECITWDLESFQREKCTLTCIRLIDQVSVLELLQSVG